MASARHRPLPRPSSSSRNPFDSSDDENDGPNGARAPSSRAYQNPFDGEDEASKAKPNQASRPPPPRSKPSSQAHAKNPFDDDDDVSKAKPKQASRPPPPRSKPSSQAHAKNPFDDDDDEEAEEEKVRSNKQGSLKAKLDQGTLFDEEPRFRGDPDILERKSKSKSPATSALKKVQKLKDAGASQASKMVEGGIHQAQRLKEGSFNAFKSSEGKANQSGQEWNELRAYNVPSSTYKTDSHDRRTGNSDGSGHTRNQLFADEARSSALDKGGLGVYSDGGQGLYETSMPSRTHYEDHQFQGADLEQRSVQELEGYALQKSEDTTQRIQNCLKVAEDIKGDATRTLVSLHQQGEQLRRTHEVAHDIDQSLTTGEKLLGSLGGMFSRTWKPKRSPAIKGPVDDPKDFQIRRKGHHLEQRNALGLDSKIRTDRPYDVPDSQEQTTEAKLKVERTKQDDALSDLSNVLDQLKEMSMDMGNEIGRQNVSLDNFQDDVVILDERVKGANVRGRRLLGK
ncbi:hypothetical protein GOP47_0011626 [Adiantum capillus-veneris]|uniref:t-SNARE coiled-coil homology domain-containing protein n=1 Tax=Adiantum capillus-veneris TaxID=13818 RepID=A0A9D4ZFK6_ADICA|nr:hypothetical protein GOP47_0011626 [Adiantum capillus-veneris]